MGNGWTRSGADWAGHFHSYALLWGLPHLALVLGLFAATGLRTAIWLIALAWMGVACIANGRRCRRTHCRYTGPFYLAMIAPVFALGSGAVSVGIYGWLLLGAIIFAGGKLVWWLTERKWGRFS
jgi:hypothetical protein